MLRVGLTGGIGAGKSTVARRLVELGAGLVDADQLAREVVQPGSVGLARVVEAFGPAVLGPDGALDRPALGDIVFGDPVALQRLNGILHPLVGARTAELMAAAPADGILVQDIPLLVEGGAAPSFPLVVVVDAPEEERVRRLVADRGMSQDAARARIAAQADHAARRAAADIWVDNSGSPDAVRTEVDRLWTNRLVPFEAALREGQRPPSGPPVLVEADPSWPEQYARLAARIARAVGDLAVTVDHIGSTAVPGLAAKNVIDVQLGVRSLTEAHRMDEKLREVGFVHEARNCQDNPKPSDPDPARWRKRFYHSADPGRPLNLHVREVNSAGFRFALLFRDWLRDDAAARSDYLTMKRRLAAAHVADPDAVRYANAKEPWFDRSLDVANRWARTTGWRTPIDPTGTRPSSLTQEV
ncbi:MAG: dephospho-CoA kinase [Pseudonocardia sp.]